jgi:hypothetical protein
MVTLLQVQIPGFTTQTTYSTYNYTSGTGHLLSANLCNNIRQVPAKKPNPRYRSLYFNAARPGTASLVNQINTLIQVQNRELPTVHT